MCLPPSPSHSLSLTHTATSTVHVTHRLVAREVGDIVVKPILLEGSCTTLESVCGRGSGPVVTSTKKSSGKELTREPYTCERLTQMRGGYTPLTTPTPVLQFDFTDPEVS